MGLILVFTCIEFCEWLSDLYFYIAFPSGDRFRSSLTVYSIGGYDYRNAVMVEVNIRMFMFIFFNKNQLLSGE